MEGRGGGQNVNWAFNVQKKHAAFVYFAARVEKKLRIKRVPHWGFRPILAILGINLLRPKISKPLRLGSEMLLLIWVLGKSKIF